MNNANQKKGAITPESAVLQMEEVINEACWLLEATTKLLMERIEADFYPGLEGATACGLLCQSIELRKRLKANYDAVVEEVRVRRAN